MGPHKHSSSITRYIYPSPSADAVQHDESYDYVSLADSHY